MIKVRVEDGQALAVQNNCHFAELSAAEDVEGVALTMTALFREVRTLKSQRTAVRQKKPSLMHVTKLFSSLIGRSSSSSNFNAEVDVEKPRLKTSSTSSSIHTSDESEIKGNTPTEKEAKPHKGIKKRPSFSLWLHFHSFSVVKLSNEVISFHNRIYIFAYYTAFMELRQAPSSVNVTCTTVQPYHYVCQWMYWIYEFSKKSVLKFKQIL